MNKPECFNYDDYLKVVEENKELKKKLKPTEPCCIYEDEAICPFCGEVIDETDDYIACSRCGQVIDWRNW